MDRGDGDGARCIGSLQGKQKRIIEGAFIELLVHLKAPAFLVNFGETLPCMGEGREMLGGSVCGATRSRAPL